MRSKRARWQFGTTVLVVFAGLGCTSSQPARPESPGVDGGVAVDADGVSTYDAYILPPTWSGHSPVVVTRDDEAVSLAIDDAHVYWQGTGGSLFACPLAGCSGSPTLLSSLIGPGLSGAQTLSVSDGVALFITSAGSAITSLAYTDPSQASTVYPSGTTEFAPSIAALVTDATRVYFTSNVETDAGDNVVTLASCPLQGSCAAPQSFLPASESGSLYEGSVAPIFVAGSELYFDEVEDTAKLRAIPVGGGSARTVCSTNEDGILSNVQSLVVVGGYAYFTSPNDPTSIYQCATTGVTLPTRYIQDYAPLTLATDGTNLYWTNYVSGTGTVATCALGATCTSPFTIAINQDGPFVIAANATSVFWATSSAIYRADK
jgi:hypothetical protein